MNLPVSVFIGFRYLRSQRSNGFASFISIFAMGGMALGVFSLIVVLSVMNGFDDELKRRILRVTPHATAQTKLGSDQLIDWQSVARRIVGQHQVTSASPYVGGNVLLTHYSRVEGGEIRAVSPEFEADVSPISQFMVRGSFDALQKGEFRIVLGSLLASSLGANVGDKVRVTLPKFSVTLAGVFPRSRRFTVAGIFEAGAQVDQYLALIHLADGQRLFRTGDAVDGLRLRFDDIYQASSGATKFRLQMGDRFHFIDWSQTQGSLFRAVKLEKTVTGILLGIIIAVAAFNIITSLIMMVTEKHSDIAVLRTLGMERKQIRSIFIVQGFVTGTLGTIVGVVLGVPVALYLDQIIKLFEAFFSLTVFDPSVYFVTTIPSLWQFDDTFVVCTVALFSSILATLYPAHRASKIEPAEALRYKV